MCLLGVTARNSTSEPPAGHRASACRDPIALSTKIFQSGSDNAKMHALRLHKRDSPGMCEKGEKSEMHPQAGWQRTVQSASLHTKQGMREPG